MQKTDSRAVDNEANRHVEKQFETFLTRLKGDKEFLSKDVFVEESTRLQNIRYIEFWKNSYFLSTWHVKEENVRELSHTINIVLSCEYSEIIYQYVIVIDKCFDKCMTGVRARTSKDSEQKLLIVNECFETYRSQLLDNVFEHFQSMTYLPTRWLD